MGFVLISLVLMPACSLMDVQGPRNLDHKFPELFSFQDQTGNAQPNLTWESSFPDRFLLRDIKSLSLNNFNVKAALAKVEQAVASYGIRQADQFPVLSASTGIVGTREKNQESGAIEGTSSLSLGTDLSWELDLWGKLEANTASTKLALESEKMLAKQVVLDLQSLLIESWIKYHGAIELELVLEEQQTTNAQFLSLTELRLVKGHGNGLDVLQQSGLIERIKREVPAAESQKKQAANAYSVLLGQLPGKAVVPTGTWPELSLLSVIPSPLSLLQNRPDLRVALLNLQAADQQVAAAIMDRFPSLTLEIGRASCRERV